MHALKLRRLGSIALVLTGVSCAEPEPQPLTIGLHEVELAAPAGWEHLDHGREQRFENGLAQISVADLGPVNRDGFEREIAHSRELFRQGQIEDSREHLQGLNLRAAFPSIQRWRSFAEPWESIRLAGLGHHTEDPRIVESAYAEVLGEIAALPRPDLETLAASALEALGHDERYDIARQEAMAVSGRPALLIDTWDRLSHAQRRRHLFVLNDGNLLVARTELGRFSELEPVFDELVASLRFRSQG